MQVKLTHSEIVTLNEAIASYIGTGGYLENHIDTPGALLDRKVNRLSSKFSKLKRQSRKKLSK